MTKTVRIENADISSYKVRVTAQEKNAEGAWVDVVGEKPTELNHPTALATVGVTACFAWHRSRSQRANATQCEFLTPNV
jgi:hypothetical protein